MPDTNTSHRTMSNTRHAEILTQYDDLLAILDEEGPTIAAAKLSSSRDAFLSEYAPDEKTAEATKSPDIGADGKPARQHETQKPLKKRVIWERF